MTKQEEIQVLRDAAARLGASSYCGPWLLEVIAAVEHASSTLRDALRALGSF
jgi:hypothetical protein